MEALGTTTGLPTDPFWTVAPAIPEQMTTRMAWSHKAFRWPWAALVVLGLALLAIGLGRTAYFEPTDEALQRARSGTSLILAGSLLLMAAAAWSHVLRIPGWVAVASASPAVLCGGFTLLAGESLFPQLSALLAYPLALAALVTGLLAGHHRT